MVIQRPATMDDARLLWEWRNDSLARAMSASSEPVAWEDHLAWLRHSLADPNRQLSVYELNGVPIGTTRLDYQGDAAVFSITVAPEYRGRVVVRRLYELGLPSCRTIGHVKPDNEPARRLCLKCGFILVSGGGDDLERWERPARMSRSRPVIRPFRTERNCRSGG